MLASHGTLTASTVATVTLDTDASVSGLQLEVMNRDGAAEIYFTLDGSAPTVGGANNYVLPAGIGGQTFTEGIVDQVVVKLISAGTPKYSVTVS